jgi:hypothetical protein
MDPATLALIIMAAALLAHAKSKGVTTAQVDALSTQLPTNVPAPTGGTTTTGSGGGAPAPAPSALPSVAPAPGAGGWQPSAVACNGTAFSRVWIRGGVLYMNGTPITIDAGGTLSGNFLQCGVNAQGVTVAVFQDSNGGGHIITSGGLNVVPVGTVGNYPIAVRVLADGSFQVYVFYGWQPTPGNLAGGLNIIPINALGTALGTASQTTNDPATGVPIAYSSQGFAAGIDAHGSPLWTDQHRGIVVGGHTITLPIVVGDYTIGQANEGPTGYVAWKQSTQQFFRITNGVGQIAPTAALRNDGAIDVGITDDPGGFYPLSSWTAQNPATVPPIDPGTHPSFLGFYPDNNANMAHANCRIVYGTGLVRIPDGALICPWVDTEYDTQRGLSYTQSITAAPSPKIVYYKARPADSPPPAEFWNALGPGDRVAFPLYRNQGEDIRTFEIAGRNNGNVCNQQGRNYVIVAGLWTRGFLSEAQVLETGQPYRRLTDWPGCDGMVVFGLGRGTSIGQFLPSFQQLADEFTSAGLPALGGPTGGTAQNTPAPSSTPASVPNPPASAYPGPAPIPTPAGIDWIRANFCNLKDMQGTTIFTVGLLTWFTTGNTALWRDWIDRLKAAGSTHVFVSPQWSYNVTPPYPVPGADVRSQPDQWRAFLNEGLTPVCFMSGCAEGRGEIDQYWPGLFGVMGDLQDRVIVVPGWEPIPGTSWVPDDVNYALGVIHGHLPNVRIHYHTSPERWTGCGKKDDQGRQVDGPDPWDGDEAGFWSSLNGVFLSGVIYETGHDQNVLAPVVSWNSKIQGACGGGVTLYPTNQDSWVNRFSEGVFRSVLGNCTWRRVFVCLGETVASNYIRNGATDADARRVATDGGRVAAWLTQSPIGYGNGLPEGW